MTLSNKVLTKKTEEKDLFYLPAKSTRLILLTVSEGRLFSRIACREKTRAIRLESANNDKYVTLKQTLIILSACQNQMSNYWQNNLTESHYQTDLLTDKCDCMVSWLGVERDDDLCVLDSEDGMGPAAGIVVVGCCCDSVGNALFQKLHGLLVVCDHMLWQVWWERNRQRNEMVKIWVLC